MKKEVIIGLIILILLGLIGCQKSDGSEIISLDNPFIGGTTGIEINFENLRPNVRDQAQDPFEIILKIENNGETNIAENKINAKISGINPIEFSTTSSELIKKSIEESISKKKTTDGQITKGNPIFIEFTNLNYKEKIIGTQITFPIKADICYLYKTEAIGKLCIREDVLKPSPGICQISGDKTIYSSSAPIQITNLNENARSTNRIGFTFEVINAGTGTLYQKDSQCDKTQRQNENKIFLRIETNLEGLSCTGLENKGRGISEGYTNLYAGSKLISCTQTTPPNDFEQVIKITAEYDYEISKTSQITVKSSDTI
jgi:hypothetical protein